MKRFKKIKSPKRQKGQGLDFSLLVRTFIFSLLIGILLGVLAKEIKIRNVKAYQTKIEREQETKIEKIVQKIENGAYQKDNR